MKKRLRMRIRYSLTIAILSLACLGYCINQHGQTWGFCAVCAILIGSSYYLGSQITLLEHFDDMVYDCRIPMTLVEPMTPIVDPHGMFGDEYWRDVNEQMKRSQQPRFWPNGTPGEPIL